MASPKPVLTGTWHTLPFGELYPLDFERLCLWLVRCEGYKRAEHLGQAGSEEGRDVVAWKNGRRFVFQCKRVESFTAADACKEIEKLHGLPADEQPHELVFVVSTAVSAKARRAARAAWGAEATCHFWVGTELDAMVKSHPKLLKEFFQLSAFDLLFALAASVLAALAGWWERKHTTELSPKHRIGLGKKVERLWFSKIPEGRRLHIRWEEKPDAVGRQPVPGRASAEVAASELVEYVLKHFLGQERSLGWSLLILGASGSGKTIALLELARGLARGLADRDPKVGVPVVFQLASWKRNDRSLAAWMARELKEQYQAGSKGAKWIKHDDQHGDQILPLLDGLDEVEEGCRPGCVDAINDYLEERGLDTIMAVTCCTQANEELPVRLHQLETAVALRPLEPAQIEEYLDADPALAGLRAKLADDAGLQKRAPSPLELSLLVERTYRNAAPEDLPAYGPAQEERVWEDHVTDALGSEPKLPLKGRARALRSLAWLARGMAKHGHPVLFQVERLQPAWLTSGWQVFTYAVLSRSLGGCLLGLPIALLFGRPELAGATLLAGAVVGAVETVRLRREASPDVRSLAVVGRWIGWALLLGGVAFLTVLLLGIPFWVDAAPNSEHWSWRFGILVRVSLLFGLLFGLVFSVRGTGRDGHRDIRVAEALVWTAWSWRGTALGASSLAILSLACWVLFLLGSDASLSYLRGPDFWVPFSLIAALLGGLLFGAFGGLEGEALKEKDCPNQGTWLALRNAGVVGLIMGLATALGLGLVLQAYEVAMRLLEKRSVPSWWALPMNMGLVVGVWSGLAYSGLDFVQHFSLRLIIRLAKLVPGPLVDFLNDAAGRGLLQQADGSYQFYHPRLRKWFAKSYGAEPDRKNRV